LEQEVKTSAKGIHLMHDFEGYRNRPYKCSAKIWTVGWGHAMYGDQLRLPNVRTETYTGMIRDDYQLKPEDNRVWSKEELVEIFKNDLETFERGVLRLVPGVVGRQGAFDALVSISFNFGLGNLQRSTIRMRANRGDWEGAAEAFRMWVKGGGKVLPGLVRRREAEIALFLSTP
jgi:lysozyme